MRKEEWVRVYLFIALVAALATFLSVPLVRHLAICWKAVGEIRSRDMHTVPTPRMGGVGMLIGFVTAICFARSTPWISGLFHENNQLWIILIGAVAICALGVLDDIFDLDWMLKLAGQIFVAVFVAWKGVQIIAIPWGRTLITASPSISMAITAFLIVLAINAVNFVDGLDGLAAGIVAIGGISFGIYTYILSRSQPSFAAIATVVDVALIGICIGFLFENWHPAKLFMGDSGSMLLGYLIACTSLIVTGRFDPATMHSGIYLPVFMPILLPALVLFLPILDMILAIIRRLAHGQSPMHPDRMHLHHRMIKIGHSVQSAVLILWGWAFLISFTSISILFFPFINVLIAACIGTPLLAALTLMPHYRRRWAEIKEENQQAAREKQAKLHEKSAQLSSRATKTSQPPQPSQAIKSSHFHRLASKSRSTHTHQSAQNKEYQPDHLKNIDKYQSNQSKDDPSNNSYNSSDLQLSGEASCQHPVSSRQAQPVQSEKSHSAHRFQQDQVLTEYENELFAHNSSQRKSMSQMSMSDDLTDFADNYEVNRYLEEIWEKNPRVNTSISAAADEKNNSSYKNHTAGV